MATVRISNELIEAAMHSAKVRAALDARTASIARKAEAIAASEDVDVTITTQSGTRPRGRPYGRVVSDNPDAEWGTSRVDHHRILGRAAQ